MISADAATQRIREAMPSRPSQSVGIADAGGKILAQDVRAERDQPPFDRVMMDGIAIDHATFAGGNRSFHRQGVQAAGAPRQTLRDPAHCIEIMTGAVLPANCDCVIPIEQVRLTGQQAGLNPDNAAQKGQFIHRTGSDYRRHEILLTAGTLIGGPEMAVLASAGSPRAMVALEPAIIIFAVGDELIDPGAPVGPSQIRRSNDFAIDALLRKSGLGSNERRKLPDNPDVLRTEIGRALPRHDIVILTGGVSMGKYDYIPSIMDDLGVEILLHKVAQTPGKPIWVGRRDDCMVFALPGNPVSSLVCARRYVIPAIHGAMGYVAPTESARLGKSLAQTAPLTWFVPVTLHRQDSDMVANPEIINTSGDFHTLAGTTGFVELPADQDRFPGGFAAPLWRW